MSSLDLLTPLKRYFGHESFKPLQEAIIRDVLAECDVVALLPTGGGKSLCYQLPALIRPGLTVVVSPLIALMKDQVDALTAAGISATFLNSSLSAHDGRERLKGLDAGKFRLLYVAPERIMMGDFLADLQRWDVSALAVDEAHCISEWGHDFRPEYRMLYKVRELFPQAPVLALTATATERVRDDIVKSLRLRNARRHVGSFNRPNLNYVVTEKYDAYAQLLAFVRQRKKESGIVYGLSRKTADMLAERLSADGIRAVPYHAGMDASERSRNQEAFIRDDADVVCATIAFGMGINKPNVRFVVHYDLPKHIEGYYQETGRAGRDGLPSQCLLLFKAGDAEKLRRFIYDITDETERERSHQKLNEMVHFAESSGCRRAALLAYFGEAWPHGNCKGCDNCLTPRETCDGTLVAQKFMSCVYRIHEKGGFGTGLNHVVEVLVGSMSQKVLQWKHNELTTYGIGKDVAKSEWKSLGRELMRLGLVRQNSERFDTLELTPLGLMTLKQRMPVLLTKALTAEATETASRSGVPTLDCDEVLFEQLRGLRKQLADAQGVPAYVIFSDVALRNMARQYPMDRAAFLRISGVGEKKLEDFGVAFMAQINLYLQTNPKREFAAKTYDVTAIRQEHNQAYSSWSAQDDARLRSRFLEGATIGDLVDEFRRQPGGIRSRLRKLGLEAHENMPRAIEQSRPKRLNSTSRESLRLFRAGLSVQQIAQDRGLVPGTIYGHLCNAIEAGENPPLDRLITPSQRQAIEAALTEFGDNVSGVVERLIERFGDAYDYGLLQVYWAMNQQPRV